LVAIDENEPSATAMVVSAGLVPKVERHAQAEIVTAQAVAAGKKEGAHLVVVRPAQAGGQAKAKPN
jgi:hypothetical protein